MTKMCFSALKFYSRKNGILLCTLVFILFHLIFYCALKPEASKEIYIDVHLSLQKYLASA